MAFRDIRYNAAQYDPIRDCTNHNGCVVEAIPTFSRVLAMILNETFQ